MSDNKEIIIKSKQRVQKHGEVFTPRRIVKMMLDQPGIKEACQSLEATFLEPSAGEGAFLVEVLRRKLEMVSHKYNQDLRQYENYSLFALATIYGVELLEDNAQRCVMNMYKVYNDFYRKASESHQEKPRDKIFRAAQYIISTNIVQGNFLTKEQANGDPIIFNEWQLLKIRKNQKRLKVQRTEYTLQEIADETKHEAGFIQGTQKVEEVEQLSLFDEPDEYDEEEQSIYRYAPSWIENVYLEELEEVNEPHTD
ncbi:MULTISPECIES: N-6 DNA methylase [Aerococcus]|uniref:N-6 DNA methylase n=1 Tax=Aerococcus TaxID=1375 RepID=UPI000DCD90BF|nr:MULTISPECIES: N-6 DNA methylase [Aerococcus]KAA9220805.1 N-6 DNA methylase [Aerococcus loyolae]KAA9265753.1 N-6 DNA methylase [Aerococcus loyolae]MCY3084067.1 SAM-dependent methyltransferase [Aerococcus mictus]MDK6231530.1 N-6 DNA methylase [Aerococcus urinae]MDK6257528.1 N-6 DNA methylase [Aerococcus urinae]